MSYKDVLYDHEWTRSRSVSTSFDDMEVRGPQHVAPWSAWVQRNGNPILPDEVYAVLRQECAKFPGPVGHDEVFAIVLERTACRTKNFGMGLSRKSGGRHVTHPDPRIGDVAEDILQRQDGHHWDVFGSAAIGNPLNPGQGPSIGVIDLRERPWVGPVCSDHGHVEPQPQPQPQPQPDPGPQPPPADGTLGAILAEVRALRNEVSELRGRLAEYPDRDGVKQAINEALRAEDIMPFLRTELNDIKGMSSAFEKLDKWLRSRRALSF
jgi:hypothetical protein